MIILFPILRSELTQHHPLRLQLSIFTDVSFKAFRTVRCAGPVFYDHLLNKKLKATNLLVLIELRFVTF